MKRWVIIVKQRDVTQPRVYKLFRETKPTLGDLIRLGVDYHAPREDKLSIYEVAYDLFQVVPGQSLREEN